MSYDPLSFANRTSVVLCCEYYFSSTIKYVAYMSHLPSQLKKNVILWSVLAFKVTSL